MNVCVIQYVKILLYACARYAYLSFSMINNVSWIILSTGTFSIILLTVHMNGFTVQNVKNYCICARGVLIFPLARLDKQCVVEITLPITHLKGTRYFFIQ